MSYELTSVPVELKIKATPKRKNVRHDSTIGTFLKGTKELFSSFMAK